MIWFFRDFLDGPMYILFSILAIIFIMAIIGFMAERKQLEREKKNREAVLSDIPSASALGTVPIEDTTTYQENIVTNEAASSVSENPVATPESVIPEEVKAANAATNAKVPEVLDFNTMDVETSTNVVTTNNSDNNQTPGAVQ